MAGRHLWRLPNLPSEINLLLLCQLDLVMGLKKRPPTFANRGQLLPIGVTAASDRSRSSEEGYSLLIAVFLLALITLSLAIAVPQVAKQIQRGRELEAMHRGKQYARAIQLYYRKFHKYPPTIDALVDTDGIRFLRKRYVDPITGKDDWQPILFGQNKLPTAIGFFGLTAAGLPIAPVGSEGDGSTAADAGGFGQTVPFGMNAHSGTNNTLSDSSSQSAQSFGGAGLIGVSIPSERHSMLVYKKQQQYDMWEFVYDPIVDRLGRAQGGSAGAGTPLSSGGALSGTPINTTPGPPISPNGNLGSPSQSSTGCGTISPNGNLPVPCQ